MDENEKPKSRLDNLRQDLYSRKKEQVTERQRRTFKERDFGVRDEWKAIPNDKSMKSRRPILKMVLIGSLAFFAFATVFSSFFFFQGADISPDNVVIEVQGPALVGGGEELGLQITITNKNPVPIETADLIIEYPDGTRSATNIDVELPRYRESLGTLNPQQDLRRNVEAVLFGEENSTKNIDILVEYRVRGSNAIFQAETDYELVLSSSPLSLVIESLEETVSGQEVEFTAKIKSNSGSVVRDVMLEVEYPFGFEFSESTPEPFFANRTWYVGDIPPEEEKEIVFSGVLSGQDGEERVFRFATGLQSESDENVIGAEFINTAESLFIKRPFITAELSFNGDTGGDFVARSGGLVRGDITWQNNLPTQVFDAEIEVQFTGSAVDEASITPESGFYRSIDNKIIWTRDTKSELGSIPSGETGLVGFSFKTLDFSSGVPLRNPVIDLDVNVRGKRLSNANVPEEITSTLSRQVKVATDLILTSKILHFTGPFQNTGPMPPKVEQETTYTVVLNVLNTSNEVANGQVVMTLPPYIEWMSTYQPLSEEISFSAVGGQIIWNLGDVDAGTGVSSPSREIAFQVRFLPSISQIGTVPIVINRQTASGFDRFAEVEVDSFRNALNIDLTESGFNSNQHAKVVP